MPANNRFNAGFNFSHDRYLGNLSVSYSGEAYWQDVLDLRFAGTTDAYTLVNGAFGVRWFGDKRDHQPQGHQPRQHRGAAAHLRRHPAAAGGRRSPVYVLEVSVRLRGMFPVGVGRRGRAPEASTRPSRAADGVLSGPCMSMISRGRPTGGSILRRCSTSSTRVAEVTRTTTLMSGVALTRELNPQPVGAGVDPVDTRRTRGRVPVRSSDRPGRRTRRRHPTLANR